MTEKQLLELLEKYAPAIRDALLEGIRDIRDNARLSEIIRMIQVNDVDGALRALGYSPAVFNNYRSIVMQAFEQGALSFMLGQPRYTSDEIGVVKPMRFNVRNPAAQQWLEQKSSTLVTGIEDDIRLAVRDALGQGMAEGRNPRSVALDLVGRYNQTTGHREGGIVGLGEREQAWARSVRQKLLTLDESYFEMTLRDKRFDGIVRKAIEEGKPLTADQVTKLVDRYRERALKARGDNIGRTEALAALNRSNWEATRQALEQSGLPLAAAYKIWKTASDEWVRGSHQKMHNQRVPIDEAFVSPSGARLLHPHDSSLGAPPTETIMCRCRVQYDIDYAYGVE